MLAWFGHADGYVDFVNQLFRLAAPLSHLVPLKSHGFRFRVGRLLDSNFTLILAWWLTKVPQICLRYELAFSLSVDEAILSANTREMISKKL